MEINDNLNPIINNQNNLPNIGFWGRVKNVFIPENPINQEINIEQNDQEEYQGIFGDIGKMLVIRVEDDIATTKTKIMNDLNKVAKGFTSLGEKDGNSEQKHYAIYDIIKTRVLQIRDYIESIFQGEYDKAEVEVNTKQSVFDSIEKDCNKLQKYARELKKSYYKDYKNFSPILGWIYIVAAVLLVFADIPLAVKLTREGFQLKEWWEVIAMSIGVALSTIYIKIYYDEFIGSPIERSVTQFKELTGIDYSDENHEVKMIKRVWWIRLLVKTFILLFSLTTIVFLGFFRFQFYSAMLSNVTGIAGINNYFNSLTQATFIFITILFPLIGGVCASLGFDKIQNHREIKNIDEKCRQKEKEKLEASKVLEVARKKLKNCESYLNWCGKKSNEISDNDNFIKDFIETYTLNFLSWYVHGYERGMTTSNLSKDFFTKAEDFRKRLLAQKTETISQKITAETFYEQLKGLQNNDKSNKDN